MFKTLLPRQCGFSTFYVKVKPEFTFRVYKIEHLFSTVGVAHIFVLHISFRHLRKLKHFKWADKRTINFECDVDAGINIIKDLKEKRYVDISDIAFLFKK